MTRTVITRTAILVATMLASFGLIASAAASASATSTSEASTLAQAEYAYHAYVHRESDALLAGTKKFAAAVIAGKTAKAKELFGPVRRHYEAIEPVAEQFGELDADVDARVNDVEDLSKWEGFHRIEKTLWTQNTTKGAAGYARKLIVNVTKLTKLIPTLFFPPAQVAGGAVALLDEVASSKITGEEDRYSHTDLSDFQGNLAGSREAYESLIPPLLQKGQAALVKEITARFAVVQKDLNAYRRNTPLGFASYKALTAADRLRFAHEVDALAEPLSTVSALVAG
jgi:iron uptake system component EfeO